MMLRLSAVTLAACGFLMASDAMAEAQGSDGGTGRSGTSRSGYHYQGHGDTFRAHAQKPPPGYQIAPSTEIEHGPDPDHDANIQRDPTTGANLSNFGTAYANSSPTARGQVGDSTGNGWVAPRGN
ncbi:hypothetical protein [Sorlinia euscelidii]|uniref:hypothetical protein n=1 Tax=Sorlinia euscelidii TaxID=3081148 RepID=UPI003AB0762A